MKNWLRFVIWTLLFFSGITCVFAVSETAILAESAETAVDQDERTYPAGDPEDVAAVILHTNDVHVAFEENIGYDGLALYKKELDELYDHVLLIDAGDAIQGGPIGAISKGSEVIRMMNRLGYDLAVPGNHEFDFGFYELDDRSEELEFLDAIVDSYKDIMERKIGSIAFDLIVRDEAGYDIRIPPEVAGAMIPRDIPFDLHAVRQLIEDDAAHIGIVSHNQTDITGDI